jgi:hypothetical protein
MKSNFKNLGPLLHEQRTEHVCALCNNFIYKRIYFDENSEKKRKTVFVCKNCLNNEK